MTLAEMDPIGAIVIGGAVLLAAVMFVAGLAYEIRARLRMPSRHGLPTQIGDPQHREIGRLTNLTLATPRSKFDRGRRDRRRRGLR